MSKKERHKMRHARTILTGTFLIGLLAVPAITIGQAEESRWPNATEAVMVNGVLADGPKLIEEVPSRPDIALGFEEARWLEVSDSRLDGRVIISTSHVADGLGATQDIDLVSNAIHIENAEGTWTGQPSVWFWLEDDHISNRVHVLTGDGAYAGMTALIELSGDFDMTGPMGVRGLILEGPVPEPAAHPYTDWQ
jgi:hypothetical protein